MTVIVQADHLAAGARAACGLLNTLKKKKKCLLNENRFFFFFFFVQRSVVIIHKEYSLHVCLLSL